jgi:toxin ParE1/3/4
MSVVSFHEFAAHELDEAIGFYDLQSPGLGGDLITEVQIAIDHIAQFPEAAPLLGGRVRKRMAARFPYSLFYSVREDHIRILAIAHQKRRPFYWRGRR